MCKPIVISQKGEISVTQCVNCKVINIWKKGMLLNFSFDQFHAFLKVTSELVFDDYLEYAPDGTEIVILATPHPDISLLFTRPEWHDFLGALHEAAYMQKVYELVHS